MHLLILAFPTLLLAAVQAAQAAPTITTQIVVSATPAPITLTASRVSDWSKYANLAAPTAVTSSGRPMSIYPKGFVWMPASGAAKTAKVPLSIWPSFGNRITITATTGNPPPTVVFTTSQIPSLTSLKTTTTSKGVVIFPQGLVWVPVAVGPKPLPSILPVIPRDYIPPQPTTKLTPTRAAGCSVVTPVVTVIISYPTNKFGDFQTTTATKPATEKGNCLGTPTTVTKTMTPAAVNVLIEQDDSTGIDSHPMPVLGPVPEPVLARLAAKLARLAYNTPKRPTSRVQRRYMRA